MSDPVPNRSRIDRSRVVPWENIAGEEIPAFGVVQLKDNHTTVSQASKPNSGDGLFFTNGHVPVADTKRGESFLWSHPQRVLLDGSVTVGDEVGPVSDQWYMSTEGTGFRVILQPTDGVGTVERVGGGSASSHKIWFTIDDVLCPLADYVDEVTLVVTAFMYNAGCNKVPPGANYDGTYDVFDVCSYLDGIDSASLIGTVGKATYMYPIGDGYCEPKWVIDDICAAPHC
jgi:hypothetical protein